MGWRELLHLAPYIICLSISISVGVYTFWRRTVQGAQLFLAIVCVEAAMTTGFILEIITPTLSGKIFWDNLQITGTVLLPVLVMEFAMDYTGREKTPVWRITRRLLYSLVLLVVLLAFTDPYHGLIRDYGAFLIEGDPFDALRYPYGTGMIIAFLFIYAELMITLLILGDRFIRPHDVYRAQVALIIFGAIAIPILFTLVTNFGLVDFFYRDSTPFAFAFSNLVVTWGLFHYRIFDLMPIAREVVMENMRDIVIVVDQQQRIVDLNPAAGTLLNGPLRQAIGQPAPNVFSHHPNLAALWTAHADNHHAPVMALTVQAESRYFDVQRTPVSGRRGEPLGELIVMRDVTRQQAAEQELNLYREQLEQRVEARTNELTSANTRLQETVDQLSTTERALRESEQASRTFLELLKELNEISIDLSNAPSLEDMYRLTIEYGVQRLGFERIGLLLSVGNASWMQGTYGVGPDGQIRSEADLTFSEDESTCKLADMLAHQERVLVWEDTALYEYHQPIDTGWRAMAGLWHGQQIIGCLMIDNLLSHRPMKPFEPELLALYSTTVGHLIKRKQAEIFMQQSTARLENLHAIEQAILMADTPREIAESMLQRLQHIIPFCRASVAVFDAESSTALVLAGFDQSDIKSLQPGDQVHTSSFAVEKLTRGDVHIVQEFAIPEEQTRTLNTLSQMGVRSYISVPLIEDGTLIGAINLGMGEPNAISPEIVEITVELANPLAVVLQQARMREQIERHASELAVRVEQRTAELREANEQLTALTQVKDEFVSNVSHELRTPIANLKLYHRLLEARPEQSDRYLEILRRETDRLEGLIEALLNLSRLDQDRIDFEFSMVDLTTLVAQYVKDRRSLAAEKHLTLTQLPANSTDCVRADHHLLGQVLSILLTNAINYTPEGGTVTVATHLHSNGESDAWVGFSVQDSGPGITPEEQAQLFTRFFRGDAGRASGVSGTGLGLAIAQEIVNRHQGRIEVTSSGIPGEGTTFTVWLPRITCDSLPPV
jgi:PAS domain S-box-containing protein